ncbi:MAG: methylated-DNA--[protein]-cysteine S-methyltransferase [Pseudomonadota bacterium]
MRRATVESPVGRVQVTAVDDAIVRIDWGGAPRRAEDRLLNDALEQLQAYFDGELRDFALPLAPAGSAFQHSVFDAMSAIPYGSTRSYGEIAEDLNGFAQAVGQACGANPIPIVIPCHRVLARDGLGGYSGAGGIETKIQLLQLEGGYPYLI